MNSQRGEASRPKQGAIEERISAGVGGVKARCPLLDAFANDKTLMTLSVDAEGLREVVRNGCHSHPACWCPLCWPQALMCCIPCIRFGLLAKCKAAAAAHHLVLREHSLLWVVDPYPVDVRSLSASFSDFPLHPSCHQLCNKEQLTVKIEEVFPLSEVEVSDCYDNSAAAIVSVLTKHYNPNSPSKSWTACTPSAANLWPRRRSSST